MNCTHCGQELQPNSIVCNNCGAAVDYGTKQEQRPPYQPQQPQQFQGQPYYNQNAGAYIPESHRPIGAWGYIGYNLLFSIPLVGIIMLFVFAFGGTGNINLRNYSRSFLIVMLITLVLWVLSVVFIFGIAGVESSMM